MTDCSCPACAAEFKIPDIQYLSAGAEFEGKCNQCGKSWTLRIEYQDNEEIE